MIAIGAVSVLLPNVDLVNVMLFSQWLNGVLLPLILYFMLRIINNKKIMGRYVNKPVENWIAGSRGSYWSDLPS